MKGVVGKEKAHDLPAAPAQVGRAIPFHKIQKRKESRKIPGVSEENEREMLWDVVLQPACSFQYFTLLMIMSPRRCIGVELYFSERFVFVFANFSSPISSLPPPFFGFCSFLFGLLDGLLLKDPCGRLSTSCFFFLQHNYL